MNKFIFESYWSARWVAYNLFMPELELSKINRLTDYCSLKKHHNNAKSQLAKVWRHILKFFHHLKCWLWSLSENEFHWWDKWCVWALRIQPKVYFLCLNCTWKQTVQQFKYKSHISHLQCLFFRRMEKSSIFKFLRKYKAKSLLTLQCQILAWLKQINVIISLTEVNSNEWEKK